MYNIKLDFAITFFIALTFVSHGHFNEQQVKSATSVSVPKYFTLRKSDFVPIVIRNRPELNGFAVSAQKLSLHLQIVPVSDEKYVVSIVNGTAGEPDLFGLRLSVEKYVMLITAQPLSTGTLNLRVTNGAGAFIDVSGLPVDEKITTSGQNYFVVLIERSQLGSFIWDDRTYVASTKGGSDYKVYYKRHSGSPPANDLTPSLERACFVLLTQEGTEKLENQNKKAV